MAQTIDVKWVALECRQRQEKVDEVYGTVNAIPGNGKNAVQHSFPGDRPYWNMGRPGERIVTVGVPLYSGPPIPLALTVSLIEHDSGNIDKYKQLAAEAIAKAAGSIAAAYTSGASTIAQPLIDQAARLLVNLATSVLGTADDPYNPGSLSLSTQTLTNPNRPRHRLQRSDDPRTAEYTDVIVVSGVDEGGDTGVYAFYFDVRVTGTPAPPPPPPPRVAWGSPVAFAQELGRVDAVSMIQSNYGNVGNLEVLARVGDRLHHWVRQDTPPWNWRRTAIPGPGMSGSQIAKGVAGTPTLIQSRHGQRGNFEVVVPSAGGGMIHFARGNDGQAAWGSPVAFAQELGRVDAVSMIQSNYGNVGNLEVLARVGDRLHHWVRQDTPPWNWRRTAIPGPGMSGSQIAKGVAGTPTLIQSRHGQRGNFEVVVPSAGGGMIHFARGNG